MIHGTMGYKIELMNYQCNCSKKSYKAGIKATIFDHFGLDEPDLNGAGWRKQLPMALGGGKFLSWYYLQHVRGYQPFKTI